MGDPLGSPRVALLFCLDVIFFGVGPWNSYRLLFPPNGKHLWILVILFGPTPTNGTGRTELRAEAVGSLEKVCASQRIKAYRIIAGKYFGCDHTSTNAPDPIRTRQLSVLGRE